MICTYNDYLPSCRAIPFEECLTVHKAMAEEIGRDVEAIEKYNELIERASDYAAIRAQWTVRSVEWQIGIDDLRTARHDAVIIQLNMLARYLRSQGKSAAWRETLGDENIDRYCRKRIGDFACFLCYVQGINGR